MPRPAEAPAGARRAALPMGSPATLGPALLAALAAALLPAAAPAAGATPPAPSPLALAPCELEHPLRLTVVAAECGRLEVPEDPQQPAGRRIALRVVRVPSLERGRRADPLFILAGGPGAAATGFYASVAAVFERVHRDRDIVLLDQRGTGGSNPLDCPGDESRGFQGDAAQIRADAARCLASLRAHAAVAWYTTSVAVRDLDAVRSALGYPRIALYGASYGTRVAQHYLRRYPSRVASLILDGVVPVGTAIGPETPLDAEHALLSILARCARDSACRGRFGDPQSSYRRVRAALAAHAVPVTLPDPRSGALQRFDFSAWHLAAVLRLASYASEYAALLPLLLDDAGVHGDFAPLAAQFLLADRAYGETLAAGMHNSVVCAEDVPFYDPRAIDRARLAATFLGTVQLDGLEALCSVWPHGPVDADFHAPFTSEVPALLLSGEDDPVTPPRYAAEAARSFPYSRQIVLAGFGHGQLTAPCMDRVIARFLARPAAVAVLDIACTRAARPLPFFTSANGPAP
jgi:pimeloyl-ACP methyl ester carboxylesterase